MLNYQISNKFRVKFFNNNSIKIFNQELRQKINELKLQIGFLQQHSSSSSNFLRSNNLFMNKQES